MAGARINHGIGIRLRGSCDANAFAMILRALSGVGYSIMLEDCEGLIAATGLLARP